MASLSLHALGALNTSVCGKESGKIRFGQKFASTPASSIASKCYSVAKVVCSASSDASDSTTEQESLAQETSAFLSDVSNLVKLVDSRDIIELELKHKHYQIIIRKKEALAPPPASAPGPHVMAHTPWPQYAPPPQAPLPVSAPAPAAAAPAPVVESAPAPPAAPAIKGVHMKSPMAGTFYKSPAPGEAAFVKVGDTIQKGQVVCIVEAMKLMNEIEADQSGVVTEILAKDGGAVSIDTPLFLLAP